MTAGGEIRESVRVEHKMEFVVSNKQCFITKTCGQHTEDFVFKKSTITICEKKLANTQENA